MNLRKSKDVLHIPIFFQLQEFRFQLGESGSPDLVSQAFKELPYAWIPERLGFPHSCGESEHFSYC